MLTIVMYHYVRDLARSAYPTMKARTVEQFEGQLDYLQRHYKVVGLRDLYAVLDGVTQLPLNACLLTFDDGVIDHYSEVFPRLKARGLTGAFFPPAMPIERHVVLDVHKIHILLACGVVTDRLVTAILQHMERARQEWQLAPVQECYARWSAFPSRFDPPEIIFVKRALQRELPQKLRAQIVDELFREFVTADETEFARGFYLNSAQIREMAAGGMEFGGHGYEHRWLNYLNATEQAEEIKATVAFLRRTSGADLRHWTMCYPYGGYNADTLQLLPPAGCRIGLTTQVDLVRNLAKPLELERLDTNDLPLTGKAEPSEWTRKALA